MEKLSSSQIAENLSEFRLFMANNKLDAFIVRATDFYLNEYIPLEENDRYYLSGFTGSTGDMLITINEAFLFVDGRYHSQVDIECSKDIISSVKLPLGKGIEEGIYEKILDLINTKPNPNIAFDGRKVSFNKVKVLKNKLSNNSYQFIDMELNGIKHRLAKESKESCNIEAVPVTITGLSTKEKLSKIQAELKEEDLHYLLVSPLDDIAYISNMRSYDIAYNSTFKALALMGLDGLDLFLDYSVIPDWISKELGYPVHSINSLEDILSTRFNKHNEEINIAFDEKSCSFRLVNLLEKHKKEKDVLKKISSPIQKMKRIKLPEEIASMKDAFHKADKVIYRSIDWLNKSINNNEIISEKDFSNHVKSEFYNEGAKGLSFEVISASGKNGAIIHYTDADPNKKIESGEMFLLDTGAYFEGGFATDLTRTFLVGGANAKAVDRQKEIYTLVLRSAIRVLKARFPEGTTSIQLDSISRTCLWEYGYEYLHGTGHGVGIAVHEVPPSINSHSQFIIEENMVFSVEPGIYIEGFSGVRIENIVTVEKDLERDGWLKIVPLTYCPLDENLIDFSYLNPDEVKWLNAYQEKAISSVNE